MDDRPGGITKNQTDLPPTKEKQEKALTPIRAGAPPQMPAVRAFSRACDRGQCDALSGLMDPL